MKRIFPAYTYGPGPRGTCWWDETAAEPRWPRPDGDLCVDVAIIGGGFTGMNAALRLGEAGLSVAVCEAGTPGWGASGRNGGFCCLGGGKITNAELTRRFGDDGRRHYRATERAAVGFVAAQIDRHGIAAETHSVGETILAHRPRRVADLDEVVRLAREDYGVTAEIIDRRDLSAHGLGAGFFGAATTPVGFALNPRKYLFGLAGAAERAGVRLCANTEVTAIRRDRLGLALDTNTGQIRADRVIVATNGYSSDDLPDWLAARYIPTQSTVLVTRPLSDEDLRRQGWTSRQMCYDTRNLLHYFRLMPDNRMLFGMRGGLLSSPRSEAAALARIRRDFEAIFPAWANVDTPFGWSGMVCLSRNLTPFIGEVPNLPGVHAALAYHGNGVAMGSYAGHLLAGRLLGEDPCTVPAAMRRPPSRFPFGHWRRLVLPPAYLCLRIADL